MSKPAATMGCNHTCPMKDGPKDHVGGILLKGSPDVFIEKSMAAREGDPLQCMSPSVDMVKMGSSCVFFNGKAAARMTDMTEHGGQIVEGKRSVLIG